MREEYQCIPAFSMWERVLRLRRQMYRPEQRSMRTDEDVLTDNTCNMEYIWEKLVEVIENKNLDTTFIQWNTYDDFSEWIKK